jgi:hypothetical protein
MNGFFHGFRRTEGDLSSLSCIVRTFLTNVPDTTLDKQKKFPI